MPEKKRVEKPKIQSRSTKRTQKPQTPAKDEPPATRPQTPGKDQPPAASSAKKIAKRTPAAKKAAPAPKVAAVPAKAPALKILMVTPEAHPYAKTGGLAEVAAALADALGRLGHEVTLVLPRYRGIDVAGAEHSAADVPLGPFRQSVTFHRRLERPGVTAVFVDIPELFDREGLYNVDGVDYPDNAWRFALFSRAALEYARLRGGRPSIVHAHDWQTGLVPVFQKMLLSPDPVVGGVPVVFTIHNLAFQGVFPSSILPGLGLGWEVMHVEALEYWGNVSYLKGGINFSERITTVSPTYAQEILTPELGMGLDGTLRRRADDLVGIRNGIDVQRWDPSSDDLVGVTYTADNLDRKAKAREVLLQTVGLRLAGQAGSNRAPVIGIISRLTDQKGFDLIAAAADQLMALDATWIMLGSGERKYEDLWRSLARRFPDRVSATIGFDERLAHRIEAGSDIFLMPSRFEPCGLNQMYSLRYGTVPIVRATGGLADTVRDAAEPDGNGIRFTGYTPAALAEAVRRALDLFRNPKQWKRLQQAGMREDFSWDASAREYVKVYEGVAAAARENRRHGI
jgi:starch synthase